MMPIRANIIGPPSVATRIKASMARLPFRCLVLGLWKPRNVPADVLKGEKLATAQGASPKFAVRVGL